MKDRDYNILQTKLIDLEHRYRILQEEKERGEKTAFLRQEAGFNKGENMQSDIRSLNVALNEKLAVLKDIEADIATYKRLGEDRSEEIIYLKNQIASASGQSVALLREKRLAETDLTVEREGKTSAEIEAEKLIIENKRLNQAETEAKADKTGKELESINLSRKLDNLTRDIEIAKSHLLLKNKELESVREGRMLNQKDADILVHSNKKLLDDRNLKDVNIKELEMNAAKLKANLDATLSLLDSKEKNLKDARLGLISTEQRSTEAKAELYKVKRDNETLNSLLGKYRVDVDFQKRLTEDEIKKKGELEIEKKKLETEAKLKEYEAKKAKEQLSIVQDTHEALLDSKMQLNQELDAIKDHTDLLESQNRKVNILFIFNSCIMSLILSL